MKKVILNVSELPITERVKTFEDACKVLNGRAEAGDEGAALLLADYESNANNIKTIGILTFMKLCIITAALNEGWKPTFSKDEYRWFPWFCYYTKDEIEKMSVGERLKLGLVGADAYKGGGVTCVYANNDSSWTDASHGSRLAYKSIALAEYSGKQFKDIWVDYIGKF